MERAALYVRVSTEEQTEYSPSVQLDALKKYAAENHYFVDPEHIYADEGISGRKAEIRPAFMRMIAAGKRQEFDVVLVHKYDRFSRNRDDSVLFKAMLKKAGVRVISIMEPIPEDDKFAVIYESMLESMAEYYSLNLAEEVRKTTRRKAEMGEWQTAAPFGYKNQNKGLVIVPEEAEIVRYLFDQYVNHNKYQSELAREINLRGVRTHRGKVFENRNIQYILRNQTYIGLVRWTPGKNKSRDFTTEKTILSQGKHEPIISKELFAAAQTRLDQQAHARQKGSKPATFGKHWLSGICKCAYCGRSLVMGYHFNNGDFIFQCGGYNHSQCQQSSWVRASQISATVLDALKAVMAGTLPDNVQMLSVRRDDMVKQYRAAIAVAKSRAKKARDAYLAGVDSLADYKATKAILDAEINKNEVLVAEALRPRGPGPEWFLKLDEVYSILSDPKAPVEQKQTAVREVLSKVVYDAKRHKIDIFLIYS
jgi:site-specific DNA recombinase